MKKRNFRWQLALYDLLVLLAVDCCCWCSTEATRSCPGRLPDARQHQLRVHLCRPDFG